MPRSILLPVVPHILTTTTMSGGYADDMESLPVFYIGQHESKRALNVSAELVQHAQDLGVRVAMFPPSAF